MVTRPRPETLTVLVLVVELALVRRPEFVPPQQQLKQHSKQALVPSQLQVTSLLQHSMSDPLFPPVVVREF